MHFLSAWTKGSTFLSRSVFASVVALSFATHSTGILLAEETETGQAISRSHAEFFERRIRPVLVAKCYECHSSDANKPQGGLRLDSPAMLRKGGESGPALVAGNVDESLLISAIRHESLEMPPEEKLPPHVIADFETWIQSGAVDPRPAGLLARSNRNAIYEKSKTHWAFQPVTAPNLPKVANPQWVQSEIDTFILSQLESRGLRPSPPASPHALLRRAHFALTGLPPTPEQLKTFENTLSAMPQSAFRILIDRLLASPQYGERSARLWLDVARYADNKGHVYYFEKTFPWAWTYRDYVVRAFNEDLPFDRFILEQLAADQLDLGEDRRPLTAMGFLTIGPQFANNTHDILDDRIDVISRGLLGITISCARCHDHKYDPVSQADYYALYGILRSSFEPIVLPEFQHSPPGESYTEFKKGLEERSAKLNGFLDAQRQMISTGARERVAEYLLAAHHRRNHPNTENFMLLSEKGSIIPVAVLRWEQFLKATQRQHDPIWTVWHAYSEIPDDQFTRRANEVYRSLFSPNQITSSTTPAPQIHPAVREAFQANAPTSIQDVAQRYDDLFKDIHTRWKAAVQQAQDTGQLQPRSFTDVHNEQLRQVLYGRNSPANLPREFDWGVPQLLPDRPTQEEFQTLLEDVEQWTMTQPAAPPRAMILNDREEPYEPFVFIRGNPNHRGSPVSRQLPDVIATSKQTPFVDGSGRLELAHAIADPKNPLTARVLVNRVWKQHFGAGLVETPSDFGLRSNRPSHPELLDWLARNFIDNGWSIKHLHRTIMNSAVYQQTSKAAPQNQVTLQTDLDSSHPSPQTRDPENRLLWKSSRRRMDFEAMRDSMIAVTGELDLKSGGPPVQLFSDFVPRRTLYGFVDRMDVAPLLRTFDFPNPAASSAGREETTIASQGLYFLNNAFIHHCAQRVKERADNEASNTADRIGFIYRLLFARSPSADEVQLAEEYLSTTTMAHRVPEWEYGYGAIDEQVQRVLTFKPLTTWMDGRWQVGPQLPDPQLGWVFIDHRGGHPAATNNRCAIRRWKSSIRGDLTMTGTLTHRPEAGNGVRGSIVSSRHGLLGQWKAHNSNTATGPVQTEVEPGDTIDFVVDFQGEIAHDEHEWPVTISTPSAAGQPQTWNSQHDFYIGPSDIWVNYVHALLMTNEFIFVD
jgi:hypothetical protein